MGYQVVAWAFDQEIKSSSVKFVLVAMAEEASNETCLAFPSISHICSRTSQDRKTVIAAINQLLAMRLITDTGRRAGTTQRVKVYLFPGPFKTVPKKELLNDPEFPRKRSRISAETVPNFPGNGAENGTLNQKVTVREPKEEPLPPTVPRNGGQEREDLIANGEEARHLICKLVFPGKDPSRPWGNEAMHCLADNLPMPRREIEIIGRARRLAASFDSDGNLYKPKHSETTLMPAWSGEVTRAEEFLKKINRGGANSDKPTRNWPPHAKEFFRWKYGPDVFLQEQFANVPVDQRHEWEREHEEYEEPPGWQDSFRLLWGEREDMPPKFLQLTVTQQDSVRKQLSNRLIAQAAA
jgi:hypothetical protein